MTLSDTGMVYEAASSVVTAEDNSHKLIAVESRKGGVGISSEIPFYPLARVVNVVEAHVSARHPQVIYLVVVADSQLAHLHTITSRSSLQIPVQFR